MKPLSSNNTPSVPMAMLLNLGSCVEKSLFYLVYLVPHQ